MNIGKVAKAWIEMWDYEINDKERDEYEWVEDFEYDAVYDNPKIAIDLVLEILKLNPENKILEVLAAGPLEQVLANHGTKIIDDIESIAKTNKEFNNLLGGVWKNSMSNEVWKRVQDIRDRSGWDGIA